jgi:hypothetical protein
MKRLIFAIRVFFKNLIDKPTILSEAVEGSRYHCDHIVAHFSLIADTMDAIKRSCPEVIITDVIDDLNDAYAHLDVIMGNNDSVPTVSFRDFLLSKLR